MDEFKIEPQIIEVNYIPEGLELPKDKGLTDNTPQLNEQPLPEPDEGENWSDIVDNDGNKPDDNATAGATAGTDLKDSSANVLDDTDVMNIRSMTAGETINGATLPVAVYQDTSDGEVYACDADDSTKLKFIGFAITNSTDGNAINVQVAGRVGGFTGLSQGVNYFVQDDKTIGTSKGTYPILVGVATSSTELKIFNESDEGTNVEYIASDNLKASADTERTTTSDSYELIKQFKIKHGGTLRIKFDLRCTDYTQTAAYARIYVNAVATGTERIESSDNNWHNYSQDISGLDTDDLVQLYYHRYSGTSSARVRNFRLYGDKVFVDDIVVDGD